MLAEAVLRKISTESGLNFPLVRRLSSSVRVPLPPLETMNFKDFPQAIKEYEIGLALPRELDEGRGAFLPELGKFQVALKEYVRTCPAVAGWIARGDFNPAKIPPELTRGQLLHACRTAGRLRARLLRSV